MQAARLVCIIFSFFLWVISGDEGACLYGTRDYWEELERRRKKK
jgi:hypothetical protein